MTNPIDDALVIGPGTMRDYAALAEHHYRSHRPATATRVLVARHPRTTVVGRFLHRQTEPQVVGVLVESLPSLSCSLRDEALDGRYSRLADVRGRAMLLNAEVRCISRVVVHPQWRGSGVAVRLMRAALAQATTVYTEALAAMGHVNPFFERAGMRAYRRPAHAADARLAEALRVAGLSPTDLASLDHAVARIDALPPSQRDWLGRELRRWSRGGADVRQSLDAARQRLSCEPVYYLKQNQARRDGGT